MSVRCSRPGCQRSPVATLTYDYGAQVATLERLASPHPMQYDLCGDHADRLTVPQGWRLVDRRAVTVVRPLAEPASHDPASHDPASYDPASHDLAS